MSLMGLGRRRAVAALPTRANSRREQLQNPHGLDDYSITSSARARSINERFKPSACAVRTFTTNSNFDGCSIGRSPGLTPCRIFLTWLAARRLEIVKTC